jgi:hypothetical protein
MPFEPVTHDPTIATLTPAEATAALAKMQVELHPPAPVKPEDSQGAKQRLQELAKDPTWAKALVNGDPAANKQFAELNQLIAAGDAVSDAIAGIVEPETESGFQTAVVGMSHRDLAGTVTDLRASGLTDASIAMAINGGTVSLAEYRAAEALQSALKSDPAWRARFLAGDYQAKRDQLLLSVILSSTIAEPK